MINRKELIEVTVEEVNKAKHKREGTSEKIGFRMGELDKKKAKTNTRRHVEKLLGIRLSAMLIAHVDHGKIYTVEEFMSPEDNFTFKEYAEKLIEETNNPAYVVNGLVAKFQVNRTKCNSLFKSFFSGQTPTDVINNKDKPTLEEAQDALILSSNITEFRVLIGNPAPGAWQRWHLLDEYFGHSTYASAKAHVVIRRPVEQYNPRREDNLAILASQKLGGGYISKERFGTLRIDHGIKQYEYLAYKISLINKAYPESPPLSKLKIRIHSQGHKYCSWYWGVSKDVDKVKHMSLEETVSALTPLGWLFYFLDDGHHSTGQQDTISFATVNKELQQLLIKELSHYGFSFYPCGNEIKIADRVQVAKYINTMLLPFKDQIPECMQYKLVMKI